MKKRLAVALAATLVAVPSLAACGGNDGPSITVYNAQHEQLLDEIIPAFEKQTGINVKLRNGDDLQLANQLVQEGDKSPADVFLTENSPAMSLVDQAGLFAKIDARTQALIPAAYRPADNDWIGFLARSTVAVYNTDKVKDADLPASILDFAKPEWKGK